MKVATVTLNSMLIMSQAIITLILRELQLKEPDPSTSQILSMVKMATNGQKYIAILKQRVP